MNWTVIRTKTTAILRRMATGVKTVAVWLQRNPQHAIRLAKLIALIILALVAYAFAEEIKAMWQEPSFEFFLSVLALLLVIFVFMGKKPLNDHDHPGLPEALNRGFKGLFFTKRGHLAFLLVVCGWAFYKASGPSQFGDVLWDFLDRGSVMAPPQTQALWFRWALATLLIIPFAAWKSPKGKAAVQ